jgi:threonyl-tRNA synthetase
VAAAAARMHPRLLFVPSLAASALRYTRPGVCARPRSGPSTRYARHLTEARPRPNSSTTSATAAERTVSATAAAVESEADAAAAALAMSTAALPTNDNSEHLLKVRHTAAHVMAMAVQKLFPKAQVTIGPWIENGFYYDFDTPDAFTERDLKRIKKEMIRIIKMKLPLTREEVTRSDARARIAALEETYKLEILDGISEPITLYHVGDKWWDLCAGPHVEHTGMIGVDTFELETVAGAYWRGDEKNAMLQRIYGTAWETPDQLKEYLRRKEEAKRRDHRMLGAKLDLFSIEEDAGGGLVFWHPKGADIRRTIEDFWKDAHVANGYELLYTPHVANANLWKTSGHLDFYAESMFDQMDVENDKYQLRPMNCPFHCLVYKNGVKSYKDLPLRWAELGTVYRYERSGTLHGLMRVRGFTQDDAHVFCLPDQLSAEIRRVLDLIETILGRFGFVEYEVMLSTRPEKSVGTDAIWERATAALKDALQSKGWAYSVDEGGGAFYGPKIDVKIKDAIGRLWQCSTVQCDFNLPARFDLAYVASDGSRQPPIMVHRAILGSIERFFGILTESYAGEFPLWLAPVQLKLLPVTDDAVEYCKQVAGRAAKSGLKLRVDTSGERLGKMVRNAEMQRIPLMAIVGEKEAQSDSVSIRSRKGGDLGLIPVDEALRKMAAAVSRSVDFDDVDDLPRDSS